MQNAENNTTPGTKPRKSKTSVTSFILSLLSMLLFPIISLPAIVFGIIGLCKIGGHKGELTGKWLAIAGIIISVIFLVIPSALFFIWSLDAKPIPNDWTIADLRSAPAEYNESYDLLLELTGVLNDPERPGCIDNISDEEIDLLELLVNANLDHELINSGFEEEILKLSDRKESLESGDFLKEYNRKPHRNHDPERVRKNLTRIVSRLEERLEQHYSEPWTQETIYKTIEDIRAKAEKADSLIEELNSFPQIAELTTPVLEELKMPGINNFLDLHTIYQAKFILLAKNDEYLSAISELIQIDSIARKLSINTRTLITKTCLLSSISKNMELLNKIINNPKVPTETIESIANHFTPLTEGMTSYKNVLLFEYLGYKKMIETIAFDAEKQTHGIRSDPVRLKKNSAIRINWNTTSDLIECVEGCKETLPRYSIFPDFFPDIKLSLYKTPNHNLPTYYKLYNPIGSMMLSLSTMPSKGSLSGRLRCEVKDDLFQIALAMRLGREYDLTARAYGSEYIVDVDKKMIFSVGPDEKAYTGDDISLPITPEVLGLVDTKTKIQE